MGKISPDCILLGSVVFATHIADAIERIVDLFRNGIFRTSSRSTCILFLPTRPFILEEKSGADI